MCNYKTRNNSNNNEDVIYTYSNVSALSTQSNQMLQIKILTSHEIIRKEYDITRDYKKKICARSVIRAYIHTQDTQRAFEFAVTTGKELGFCQHNLNIISIVIIRLYIIFCDIEYYYISSIIGLYYNNGPTNNHLFIFSYI